MNAEAEDKLFTSVTIKKQNVDSATISRLDECAIYEVCVEGLDRAILHFIASEGFSTMRESLQARIASISAPLGELFLATLIAADVDAHELNVRTLAGDTTVVLAYRFKC